MDAANQKKTKPTKVTMTVYKLGWNIKVYAGKTVISNRAWERNCDGYFSPTKLGSVYDDLGLAFADLAQAIDSDLSTAASLSGEIYNLEEGL